MRRDRKGGISSRSKNTSETQQPNESRFLIGS